MSEQKIKVLIAEDEEDIRETIAEILQDEGFEVHQALNGKQGFEKFLELKPQVIISDIMMPEVDGYAFLKLVRESRGKFNATPFIFLSALGQKENIIKGASLSANDYLVKPIDFEILIAKIKEKAASSIKLQQIHEKGISNIKNQISSALPSEISSYLDSITQMLKILKDEPYGPFPHRRYLEDINKIYSDALKLKATVTNSLDQSVIESRLNADEEIFSLTNFVEKAIGNLPERIRHRVTFQAPYESEKLPKVKIDKSVLIDIMKRVIAGIIKFEAESTIDISIITDNLDQMIVIFYLHSKLDREKIAENINVEKMKKIGESQSLDFSLSEGGDLNATLTVPSFRLLH